MISTADVRTVTDQIARQIRGDVLCGALKPGEPLREVALAQRFAVGRAIIRRVFLQLEHEGLLESKPNCGVRVAEPLREHVEGLLSPLRAQIETYALRLCFHQLTEDDFDAWKRLLALLRLACEEGNLAVIRDRDFEFHRSILVRAGLVDLVPVWTSVIGRMRDYHESGDRRLEDLRIVHFTHVALVDVFRTGALDKAVEALTQHIMNGDFNELQRQRWRSLPASRR